MSTGLAAWKTPHMISAFMSVLGTTKPSLWPFLEKTGTLVSGIGPGDLTASETGGAAEALEDDFAPFQHVGGVQSYHFHPTGDHHLAGIDHANYSFAGAAFSVGAWIQPSTVNDNTILAKYDSAGAAEEYRFFISSSGKLSLELHDASESATETAAGDTTLTVGRWRFVCATYDGVSATPGVYLYVDAGVDNDGTTTESGAFAAMEAGAAPLTIGCAGVTATPTTEFHGRIALPFLTGKALSSTEIASIQEIGDILLGLS